MSISSSSTSSYAAMSNSLHLTAKNVPGYGPLDGSCLSLSGFSQRPAAVCVSPCSSHGGIFSHIKIRSTGTPSFICMANSGGHRTNPDFSRQGKQGFSRGNNRYSQNEDRNMDDDDDDEDELLMPLKNGVYFNQKSQSTAAPGEREKEIIELFKKVQVLLREKAGVKTEKKVEPSPQGKVSKETETVGSLLNLLRKHSNVSKEDSSSDHRKNSSFSKEDTSGDQLEQTWGNNEDYKSSSSGGLHSVNKYSNGAVDSSSAPFTRPPSSFRKRTPFMRTTMPPPPPPQVDSSNEEDHVTSKSRSNSSGGKKEEYEVIPDAIHEPEDDHGSEMLLAELDDDSGEEDEEHEADDDVEDLSSLTITELKQLAKARGIKRYSKMNKSELVEVLSGGTSD